MREYKDAVSGDPCNFKALRAHLGWSDERRQCFEFGEYSKQRSVPNPASDTEDED